MSGYQCARCRFPVLFSGKNKKTLCFTCGSVNIKPAGDPSGGWLPCVLPEGFEWEYAVGVIGPDVPKKTIGTKKFIDYDSLVSLPMNARVIYKDSYNKEWTRMDWIHERWSDPAITLREFRRNMDPIPIFEIK
jgi:hypothetical protein